MTDAEIVDRIGRTHLRRHFGISDAAISYWRRKGIPSRHRSSVKALADSLGITVTL